MCVPDQTDLEEANQFYEDNKNKTSFKMVMAIEVAKAIINIEITKIKTIIKDQENK